MSTPQDLNAKITVIIKYLQTGTSQEQFVEENVLPAEEQKARSFKYTAIVRSPFSLIKTEPGLRSPFILFACQIMLNFASCTDK